jgi:hypothetical protein
MSYIVTPDSLLGILSAFDDRLRTLETNNALERATIKQGSLIIQAGASGTLPTGQPLPLQTAERARLGLQPDGSYGLRLLDASGNVIFDPVGLVGVMKAIGGVALPTLQTAQAFTTTYTNHPSTNGTFTLTRTGTVLVQSQLTHFTNGGTASYGRVRLAAFNSGAGLVGTSMISYHTNGSGVSSAGPYILLSGLPADTYTVWFQYSLDAGATTTFQLLSAQWDAFQLGG